MRTVLNTKKKLAAIVGSSVLSLGMAAAVAAPASAVVVAVDNPMIVAGNLDFGTNFVAGAPTSGGRLAWNLIGGVNMFPRLTGNLFLNNGACGRIQVQYYDTPAHVQLLGQRNSAVTCAPAGGAAVAGVALVNFSDPAVTHVHVNLQQQNAAGAFTTVGVAFENL